MNSAHKAASLLLLSSLVTTLSGCATTTYAPRVVARGELTLQYDHGYKMNAGGERIASGLSYSGLDRYVRCVPQAHTHARAAQSAGRTAIALSILGGVIGASGLIGIVGLADSDHLGAWVGGGLGLGAVGLTLAGLSWRFKNHANGNAVDAMNYYNDSVGSLGASCDDLRYPAPAGAPIEAPPVDPAGPLPTDPAAIPALPSPPSL